MTEEEAKTKWCPHTRSIGWTGSAVANRDHRGGWTSVECCVASACMMWRHTNEVTGRGYCGLAGRP